MTISEQDEREARAWLNATISALADLKPGSLGAHKNKCARTILALLDRPVMPRPEDVPDEVLDEMWMAAAGDGGGKRGMKVAIGVLHYHVTTPPPKPAPDAPAPEPYNPDAEFAALTVVFNALATLDKGARARVLTYMTRRLVEADDAQ